MYVPGGNILPRLYGWSGVCESVCTCVCDSTRRSACFGQRPGTSASAGRDVRFTLVVASGCSRRWSEREQHAVGHQDTDNSDERAHGDIEPGTYVAVGGPSRVQAREEGRDGREDDGER